MEEKPDDEIELDFSGIKNIFKKKSSEKKTEHHEEQHSEHHEEKKEHEPHHEEHHEHKEHQKKDSDEINIDFSGIKNVFKSNKSHEESEDEIGMDMGSIGTFFSSKPWLIAILLAIVVVGMSVAVRMETKNLPFTDNFAAQSVQNYYLQQIGQQVQKQNPNLPQQMLSQAVNQQYATYYAQNKQQVDNQVRATSLYFKTAWSNEPKGQCLDSFDWFKCRPYMPDIDPYYWLRYATNIENHGYAGDEKRNGVDWDTHMLAPNGRQITNPDFFPPYALVVFHGVLKVIKPDITLLQSQFFYPVIVTAATTLLVFLIARRISGNIGGLFAGALFAFSFAALDRTLFGHGDSDSWVLFFPVLATWLYLEAFEAKKPWVMVLASAVSGITIGVYSIVWGGWWYIFDFLLGMTGLYLLYQGVYNFHELKNGVRTFLFTGEIKKGLMILGTFIVSTGIFVSLFNSIFTFIYVPLSSFGFARLKNAVLPTLWPNVLTTVAELNEGNLGSVINSAGGALLFWVALLGIGASMLVFRDKKKRALSRHDLIFIIIAVIWYSLIMIFRGNLGDYLFLASLFVPIVYRAVTAYRERMNIDFAVALLLTIWFAGTTYASFKGIRFTLLLAPAFAVAFGVFFGVLFMQLHQWLKENFDSVEWLPALVVGVCVFLLFFVWFWPPHLLYMGGGSIAKAAYSIADNDVPIQNDAWWNSLTKIKTESRPNAQINSWWDFGHHFKYITDRAVSFDGTTQDTPVAHWTGRDLLTSSEEENVGILRMLACGSNNAFETLNPLNNNDTVGTVNLLHQIVTSNKAQAKNILRNAGLTDLQADSVLKYTHCDPPEMFFITSDDMIGKAGVWGHFGSWDFEKAYIFYYLKNKPEQEAVSYMTAHFNYTQKRAEDMYFQVQTLTSQDQANQWVSPWPGYVGSGSCTSTAEKISCGVQIQGTQATFEINRADYSGTVIMPGGQRLIPHGIVYVEGQEVKTKHYDKPDPKFDYSFVLIPRGSSYSYELSTPDLAESIFTRTFFLKGLGLHYLRPFSHETHISGTDIYVWKVDWAGEEPNKIATISQKSYSIDYIGYFENGTVFDSSINAWQGKNLTKETSLEGRNDTSPLVFTAEKGEIIKGLEDAVTNMTVNETKLVVIPPELGYGTDPTKNPLGNKTISFRVRLVKVV